MQCYFQGCKEEARTKEHVPPKAFFPKDQREQLITVRSCEKHNTDKSRDDLYVLAQICLNSSPRNRAREIFLKRIVPQLGFNEDAFRLLLIRDSQLLEDGAVKYRVDIRRLNRFFDSLSCGLVSHVTKDTLPEHYSMRHIFHNLIDDSQTEEEKQIIAAMEEFYDSKTPEILHFGKAALKNEDIYTARLFGISDFQSSITVVHLFFGHFKVTSLLTKTWPN
jgi:hypothetical protein